MCFLQPLRSSPRLNLIPNRYANVPHRFARERIARNFPGLDSELCNELLLVFEFLSSRFPSAATNASFNRSKAASLEG